MSTLNSRIASIPNRSPLTPPGVTASWLAPVYSMPFHRNRLSPGRRPATEKLLPSLVVVLALFMRGVVDRAGIERDQIVEAAAVERQLLHAFSPTIPETEEVVVLTSGASSKTVTACAISPTSSRRLTTASWPTSRLIPVRTAALNPVFSTLTSCGPKRQRKDAEVAGGVGSHHARRSGFQILHRDRCVAHSGAGGVFHVSGNRGGDCAQTGARAAANAKIAKQFRIRIFGKRFDSTSFVYWVGEPDQEGKHPRRMPAKPDFVACLLPRKDRRQKPIACPTGAPHT